MGKRVIVWHPESKDSMPTQYPRKIEHYVLATTEIEPEINEIRTPDISTPKTPNNSIPNESVLADIIPQGPYPMSLVIRLDYTSYRYGNLSAEFLDGAKDIGRQESYLTNVYQQQILSRFAEMVVNLGTCKELLFSTTICETLEWTLKLQNSLDRGIHIYQVPAQLKNYLGMGYSAIKLRPR